MKTFLYETEVIIPQPIDIVFDFFKSAENLEKLTPDWLHFRILTPLPIKMEKGRIIDYRIRLFGIPFKWKTMITLWEPGKKFRDEQLRGPYKIWKHTHIFESRGDSTIMRDRVEYYPKGGIIGPAINRFFVKKQVRNIFTYREMQISAYFNPRSGNI